MKFEINDVGIDWIEPYNHGRTAGGHALELASAYLTNWEWPKRDGAAQIDPRVLAALTQTTTALLATIALGVVPWRAAWSRLRDLRRPRRHRGFQPTFGVPPSPQPIVRDGRASRGPMPMTAMLIVAAWLVVPAYAFYTASGAWKPDGTRTRAATPTQAIVAAFEPGAYNDAAKTLAGALSVDVANSRAADESWPKLRERLARRPWGDLFVVHAGAAPARSWLVGLSLFGLVVLPFGRRATTWRQRAAWLAGGAGALALLYALALLTYVATPVQPRSLWMPRYIGFVWPAFAIAACVLIRRLPFAPLRWLAIALLLATNLANFAARLRYGEPPTPQIAADVVRAKQVDASRVFVFDRSHGATGFGTPGSGSIFTAPDAFYVANALKADVSPRSVMRYDNDTIRRAAPTARDGADVARRLRADAKANELTVWAELPVDSTPGDVDRELAAALGAGWTRADDGPQRTTSYDHWTWRKLYVLERHHWIRTPTTRPTTR